MRYQSVLYKSSVYGGISILVNRNRNRKERASQLSQNVTFQGTSFVLKCGTISSFLSTFFHNVAFCVLRKTFTISVTIRRWRCSTVSINPLNGKGGHFVFFFSTINGSIQRNFFSANHYFIFSACSGENRIKKIS